MDFLSVEKWVKSLKNDTLLGNLKRDLMSLL